METPSRAVSTGRAGKHRTGSPLVSLAGLGCHGSSQLCNSSCSAPLLSLSVPLASLSLSWASQSSTPPLPWLAGQGGYAAPLATHRAVPQRLLLLLSSTTLAPATSGCSLPRCCTRKLALFTTQGRQPSLALLSHALSYLHGATTELLRAGLLYQEMGRPHGLHGLVLRQRLARQV
ncbi:hypothetical protein L7F22_035275 [Adiantum nelumboides]|nr:hypothetical protein [Adiantum nelumboides]